MPVPYGSGKPQENMNHANIYGQAQIEILFLYGIKKLYSTTV